MAYETQAIVFSIVFFISASFLIYTGKYKASGIICVSVFLLSAGIILYIGKYKVPEVTKKTQLARTLNLGLWGFVPAHYEEAIYQRNLWNWRKLLICGIMICSLVVLMTSSRLSLATGLKSALGVFIIWTIGLHLFWHYMIPPKESTGGVKGKSNPTGGSGDRGAQPQSVSEKWANRIKDEDSDKRLPTTIITGFLGSGKTTLVNHLLGNTIGIKILVVENEVGQEGIDHELLLQQTKKEQIILMNNGCVCCSVRGDLIQTFKSLFASDAFSHLNWVIIETTGLADPAPVIQTLFMDEECKKHMRLDACITVVDAKHITQHFAASAAGEQGAHKGLNVPEAIQQVAFADRILLNKVDLVSEVELASVTEQVRAINPSATIVKTQQSRISPEEVLNIKAFDATKNAGLLGGRAESDLNQLNLNSQKGLFHIETDADGKISMPKKKKKGYSIGNLGRKVPTSSVTKDKEEQASIEDPSTANIAVDNLLKKSKVSTVSLTTTSLIDLDKFNIWIGQLLQEKGTDLYRFKGILAMEKYDEKFIVQGVHMLFNGERGEVWSHGAERRSRLVFIGVKLNHTELKLGFHKCLVSGDKSG